MSGIRRKCPNDCELQRRNRRGNYTEAHWTYCPHCASELIPFFPDRMLPKPKVYKCPLPDCDKTCSEPHYIKSHLRQKHKFSWQEIEELNYGSMPSL